MCSHKIPFIRYGEDIVDPEGPLPAHLLGSPWAAPWAKISSLLTPYPEKPSLDVTETMVEQGPNSIAKKIESHRSEYK